MGLFNQILGALNNPNQEANSGQLSTILNVVQQLNGSTGANPSQIQSVLSLVGGAVRSSLRERAASGGGEQQAQALVNQYAGVTPNAQAVQALFSLPQTQQLVQSVAQRTGLDANTIQMMLPIVVPVILNLLKTGTSTQNPQGNNSVLHSFLDANGDGTVDVGEALQMASRFLKR
ncbi:hypothetical protein H6G20_25155 [Desertifilum sp. FACHB-1129]|uniref:Uncharacterized protein n=1 Tax=Desertifilum tharense IPPAS B-1220 TaxID=1781255 RepID=A0A1E5QF95_9CYAN|nr:hypothetical protein [Desertifilum sp. FACHB-1129]MBD2325218.1 hypothetical protein [Desertifilum sp. FACHB-866]MBD2335332.1 hypothetical protein [Desertifilum sp. FACHB-868]MCD8488954.1 hypothetical protein [Desertifilum sp.]MDA0213543.1 hypothetical protein [Cyanobacteria bacterium FC1]MDI9634528.1 hypothetical protein [Geitlerinema splendidum]MDL5044807.1 hypothetical protein [Oscillatoria amoena NRMC-F 0135]OEJ73254.1 hypothetical protein BH720_20795 [Desertifilum tharense IPPAS B-122